MAICDSKGKHSEHHGIKLYEKEDLCQFKELSKNWWCTLDKNGEGYAEDFPRLKMVRLCNHLV